MSRMQSTALEGALRPDRFQVLCDQVAARLPLSYAEEVLELMGAASRLAPPAPPPVERAVARLGEILQIDLSAPPAAPYDWEAETPPEPPLTLRTLADALLGRYTGGHAV